jgi:hypothetical protein
MADLDSDRQYERMLAECQNAASRVGIVWSARDHGHGPAVSHQWGYGKAPWNIATVYGVPYEKWFDRRARYMFWLGAEAERV